MTVAKSTASRYRWKATTLEGFIQQLAVAYVARGYFFYVTGCVPARMTAAEHDRRLVTKFDVGQSKWSRYRRRLRIGPAGRRLANVQYLRFCNFWVLVATAGEHCFFREHQKPHAKPWLVEPQYRDVREGPVTFGGYNVSWGGGG